MKKRSDKRELMDLGPAYYSKKEYEECLQKLFLVGKYCGIHRDTYKLLRAIEPKTIVDIGCGDGAFLAAVAKKMPHTTCVGTEVSAEALAVAHKGENLTFLHQEGAVEADVIMTTLVLHHLPDEAISPFLHELYSKAKKAVIINDLDRHFLAKLLFTLVSKPLFRNRLISHDGAISIERGFRKKELIAHIAKITQSYSIRWRFPFRWQVVLWKR